MYVAFIKRSYALIPPNRENLNEFANSLYQKDSTKYKCFTLITSYTVLRRKSQYIAVIYLKFSIGYTQC